MHFTSFISAIALFIASTTATNVAQDDVLAAHQLVSRSSSLISRQLTNVNFGSCESQCSPINGQVLNCGADLSCLCGTSLSAPFHDCVQCAYNAISDSSVKSQLTSSYNQYLEACKQSGSPVKGDTSIGASSSSSKSNDASPVAAALGLPAAAAVAISALLL
ncbi:hypothetical protein FRB90_010079 [Tulasnella sp. 427]|nr:hypothetical protein FRB90_010079 [Tulasnella sp. 427]